MKKFFAFICVFLISVCNAHAAVRGENAVTRGKNVQQNTTQISTKKITPNRTNYSRSGDERTTVTSRSVSPRSTVILMPKSITARKSATRQSVSVSRNTTARTANNTKIISRAAATKQVENTAVETKTGAEYEQCKTAFFTCMDQFCQLKNDNFRRCSCSDRVYDFQDITETYQEVSERLTEFSENLDVVGMTRAQAKAMKTASEGEDALAEDKSASKQLLQAIMDSISGSGKKASVGGKYQQLNMVDVSGDMSNAFGSDDSGQLIASYNGATLYKAVFPSCRAAVAEDCNSASLQRAINAYLMAVEQDCNTVASALKSKAKTLKNATHESSALLDLARVENRQKHNSDDFATCLTNVETAVKSDQVCSADYHKCLDYGQFIDVTTGAPLTGVADFYKLSELLTFPQKQNLKDQQLSKVSANRKFVQFFENKTKKFASDALDACTDIADEVWQQYLDRALLDIYYAQKDKVKTIQDSCINVVKACYDNQGASIAQAMANLTGDFSLLEKPNAIALTTDMCEEYIQSCNNMFTENVIKNYVDVKDTADEVTACRVIAQQCFDNFGGTGYENFYHPHSGLFDRGKAIDWFSLYNLKPQEQFDSDNVFIGTVYVPIKDESGANIVVSPCAKELLKNDVCKKTNILEKVFGGFNRYVEVDSDDNITNIISYAYLDVDDDRSIRQNGVATEVYYKIIDNLTNTCDTLKGYFVQHQFAEQYGYSSTDFCKLNTEDANGLFFADSTYMSPSILNYWYHFIQNEDICPQNYNDKVDVQSWGACSCWENGGYRSKNGATPSCLPILPVNNNASKDDVICTSELLEEDLPSNQSEYSWCQQSVMSSLGQVCPRISLVQKSGDTSDSNTDAKEIETVTTNVPHHKSTGNIYSTDSNTVETRCANPIETTSSDTP